jgi:two-component system sensor histidine kinase YesM
MKVSNALGDVVNTEFSSLKGSSMLLVDQKGNRIAATAPGPPDLGADILHTVKQSEELNWTIHIFVPLKAVTEELGVLKRIYECTLIVGGAVCFGLAWFLSKRITMPIRKLRKKMGGVHIALPQTNEESYFNQEINELNQAYNKLVRELHRLVETVYEKERLKNRAEIKMLQAQIHPHFLFNTLESLYWTLSEKKDRDGARLVVALSKLFRYSIRATSSEGDDWVALSEEIDHCRRFLEIMKFRLAHRLEWEIRMPEELGRVAVPKLLIQPIVENAIQHGIERSVGQGVVALDVESVPLEDGTPALRVRVRDNGPGMGYAELERLRRRLAENGGDDADGSGKGIGLANIAKRVRMHYGAGYGLRLDSAAGRGTEVQLVLPNGGASR